MIAEATGNRSDLLQRDGRRGLARSGATGRRADRGDDARGAGRAAGWPASRPTPSAVLHNGLGRHAEARDAARSAFEPDHLGFGPFVVPELAEAAARTGDAALLASVLEWLTERTRVTRSRVVAGDRGPGPRPDERGRGRRARVPRRDRSPGPHAAATGARPRAPALRRVAAPRGPARRRARAAAHRPRDARRDRHGGVRRARPPRAARDGREGAQARRRHARRAHRRRSGRSPGSPATACPTPRSAPGSSSAPRTVEWHLGKVFAKLGITSRMGLRDALPGPERVLFDVDAEVGPGCSVGAAHRDTTTCLTSAM